MKRTELKNLVAKKFKMFLFVLKFKNYIEKLSGTIDKKSFFRNYYFVTALGVTQISPF
jgi:hypothetical protein